MKSIKGSEVLKSTGRHADDPHMSVTIITSAQLLVLSTMLWGLVAKQRRDAAEMLQPLRARL